MFFDIVYMQIHATTNDGIFTFEKRSNGSKWEQTDHEVKGTNVKCIIRDPTDGSLLYAGTENGEIFKYQDRKWVSFSQLNGIVYRLAAHQMDDTLLYYAGIEPAKLFVSMNECNTWRELNSLHNVEGSEDWHSPWGSPDLSTIAFNPKERRQIYVGIEVGGVMRSRDEGASWTDISSGLHRDVHTLAVNYYNPKIIFAATGGGIYRTVNGGIQWAQVGNEIDLTYAVSVAIHPSKPNITYLGIAMSPPGNQALLYKSEDYGESWSLMHTGLPYPMLKGIRRGSLIVNNEATNEVYVGTSNGQIYYSPDEGSTFQLIAETGKTVNAIALSD